MVRYLWIVWAVLGIWMLASAATQDGLMPSGHGLGRFWEIVIGIAALAYAVFRSGILFRKRGH